MATATATKRASTKTATKSTASKTATKSASKTADSATTTRTVRKSAAKKAAAAKEPAKAPAKKAVATKTVAKSVAAKKGAAKKASTPRRGPVLLNGEPAHNRHFMLTRSLYDQATDRCDQMGISLSEVLRHGLDNYGAKAPSVERAAESRRMPKTALNDLARLYRNDSGRLTEYLAACHRAGWSLQALADALVESGAVDKISRQAVSLRVLRSPEELRTDLPPVPAMGPRRPISSPRKGRTKDEFEQAYAARGRERSTNTYDFAFRVTDTAYELASRRAKHEGASISGVLDVVLTNFLNGKYDKVMAKIARKTA